MRRTASILFTLATGLLVTIAGLAFKLNALIVLTLALFAAGAVFYLVDYRTRPDRRIFLNGVTVAQLKQLYAERTTVQAQKATSIYLGKWMEIEGAISDVQKLSIAKA